MICAEIKWDDVILHSSIEFGGKVVEVVEYMGIYFDLSNERRESCQ